MSPHLTYRRCPFFLGIALLVLSWCVQSRGEELRPPELREGNWIYRGVRNIIGRGRDEILSLRRERDGWTIERTFLHHPSVNEHRSPEYSRSGAHRIRQEGIYLVEEAGPEVKAGRRTFRWEGERLVYPAVVRTESRTWKFASPGQAFGSSVEWEFHCQQNPMEQPIGEAELKEGPGASITGTYLYELLPPGAADDPNAKPPPAQLRFLVRQGNVFGERFALRWDHWGAPSYRPMTYDPWRGVNEVRYEPITQEALEKLLAGATQRPEPAPVKQ